MRIHCLILFLWTSFFVNSQEKKQFSIEWSKRFEQSQNKNIWIADNIHIKNGNIPLYLYDWKKENNQNIEAISFYDIVTKELNGTDLIGVDISLLPNEFNPSLKVIKERETQFYSVQANALYKSADHRVLQVQSFRVKYSLNNQARTSRVLTTRVKTNSVLSTGTWYKIAVDKSGVFKIDASFLSSIGVDVKNINPKHIRIYGNGGAMLPEVLSTTRKQDLIENAIFVAGENDNVFNNNDYVLFYAQGPMSWDTESRLEITHKQNIYSDYAYYFINVDGESNGKRILNAPIVNNTTTKTLNTFTDYRVHEKELYNYIRVGRQWFGEDFTVTNNQSFNFNFFKIDTSQEVLVHSAFSAKSASMQTKYSLASNGTQFINAKIDASGDQAFTYTKATGNFTATKDNVVLNVLWDGSSDSSAQARLDYIEVIADRFLEGNGTQYGFLNFNSKENTGGVLEYVITKDATVDFVWNITDFNNPKRMTDSDVSSDKFRFKEIADGSLEKYQIVTIANAFTPIKLNNTKIVNQNLHALQDVQYLIVTQKEFIGSANKLANYHRNNTSISATNKTKLNVAVVDLEQIYNEFGSGSPDITAIRDFAKYLYDNGSSDDTRLKYLCLFGDASFDYKKNIFKNEQIVPVYLSTKSMSLSDSYNSDDYYGFLDETDDSSEDGELDLQGKLDIITGRIPVATVASADQYVNKILNYYSTKSFGPWKNKITLLGDDGQEGKTQNLIRYLENSSLEVEKNNKDLNITKLYTDAYKEEITSGGGRYPEVTQRFHDAFTNGSLVINYFGHGNVVSLGEEVYLDVPTIRSFRNLNNLPLFVTVTCDFSRFDDPTIVSAGEEMIDGAYGGAAMMITTSREITISTGNTINLALADYLYSFDGKTRTVAEALKDVKNITRNADKFFVYFFGDPAMKLSLPKSGIELSKVEKYITDPVSENESLKTTTELNGLSKVKVSGKVTEGTAIKTDFNGTLSVVLYDKEIDRKTLLNEPTSVGKPFNTSDVVSFKSLENKVFVGEATVKNGLFSFDFILPKDVSVTPENAKFSFYADSNTQERIGSDFNYKVGGIDPNAKDDTVPPVIQLFIGDETFVDGGNTSRTPKLLAKIQDDSGVNTSLNSIGHDITVVIDGDLANPISLNEFYTTEKDDFTKGVVTYKLPELTTGNHTLLFKAWDTYNNSSTQTLNFYAQEDKGFKISKVLNYPNPFINHTEFWFKNNRQGDPLEIRIQIYTLSGKLIKTILRSEANTDDISRIATWDGRDDFGNRLGKGIYIYKLTVKEIISGQSDEKIEKLVIL